MHCSPAWRKKMQWFRCIMYEKVRWRKWLRCWIIVIWLSPQHKEILLLRHIAQFIRKTHTVSILHLGPDVCAHGIQMLPNEPEDAAAGMSFSSSLFNESYCGFSSPKIQTIDKKLTLLQTFIRLLKGGERGNLCGSAMFFAFNINRTFHGESLCWNHA